MRELNSKKAFIAIAAHKMCAFPDIPYHVPVCVGAVKNRKEYCWPKGTVFDDDGMDNISSENPVYNELTAQYYMWKNINSYEYYGICHYRRYFNFGEKHSKYPRIPAVSLKNVKKERYGWTEDAINKLLERYDVLVAKMEPDAPLNYSGIYDFHMSFGDDKRDNLIMECISLLCPEYIEDARVYFAQNEKHMFNMFIMRSEIFHEYCEWLFRLLDLYENRLKIVLGEDTVLDRTAGFMGEHLLNIYVSHLERKKICIGELQTVMFYDTTETNSLSLQLKAVMKMGFGLLFPYGSKQRDWIKWKYLGKD